MQHQLFAENGPLSTQASVPGFSITQQRVPAIAGSTLGCSIVRIKRPEPSPGQDPRMLATSPECRFAAFFDGSRAEKKTPLTDGKMGVFQNMATLFGWLLLNLKAQCPDACTGASA
ncbi:unnamed protein product [Effrenium voratum]|nr:unnamed protein product [Effrenium voratum]